MPSFVAKESVRKTPFIGIIAKNMRSFFMSRTGTKE
jgi:1-acyl-sn-glycerol-3-phosphate acyltransferase